MKSSMQGILGNNIWNLENPFSHFLRFESFYPEHLAHMDLLICIINVSVKQQISDDVIGSFTECWMKTCSI